MRKLRAPHAIILFKVPHPAPRPPATGKLLVNFDKDILTLLREARHMRGLGLAVPEAAAVVAMQDGKLKGYYNDLTHALKVCGFGLLASDGKRCPLGVWGCR